MILIVPRLLSFIVAIYLIIVGLIGLIVGRLSALLGEASGLNLLASVAINFEALRGASSRCILYLKS